MMRILFFRTALVFLLLLNGNMVHGKERTTFYPIVTWVCSDQKALSIIDECVVKENGNTDFATFPDGINVDDDWNGILFTDGNKQWTIMSFGLKRFGFGAGYFNAEKLDDEEYRDRLFKHPLISRLYRKEKTKLLLRKARLYVLANDFPVERLDELEIEKNWMSLRERHRNALLLDNFKLSLKIENEKKLLEEPRSEQPREKSSASDSTESVLITADWGKEGRFKGTITTKLRDGTKESKQIERRIKRKDPFGLSGFFFENEDVKTNGTLFYRWYPEDNAFGEKNFALKSGVVPLGPEDQVEGKPKKTNQLFFDAVICSEPLEELMEECRKEGYEVLAAKGILLAKLAYPDEMSDQENYLTAKSGNESFVKCLEVIHDLIKQIQTGLDKGVKEGPVDFGFIVDEDSLTLAVSTSDGRILPDKISILPLIPPFNSFLEILHRTAQEGSIPLVSLDIAFEEIERTDGTKYSAGQITLRSKDGEIPLAAFLSAENDHLFALQIATKTLWKLFVDSTISFEKTDLTDMNEFRNRNFIFFKQCVEKSDLGKSGHVPAPENFIQITAGHFQGKITEYFSEREYSYSMVLHKNSQELFVLVSKFINADLIEYFIPF